MCHLGVLWSVGYLGKTYFSQIEPYMKRLIKFLEHKDGELRGMAVWAMKRLQYQPAFAKIENMAEDDAECWIYEDGIVHRFLSILSYLFCTKSLSVKLRVKVDDIWRARKRWPICIGRSWCKIMISRRPIIFMKK